MAAVDRLTRLRLGLCDRAVVNRHTTCPAGLPVQATCSLLKYAWKQSAALGCRLLLWAKL
jgi:hypothetical protein